ncbi:hypothetical protein D3C72_2366150 [compost metagenome]
MPAYARLAQNALAAMQAIDMGGKERLAGKRRPVGNALEENGRDRRTDQSGKQRPPDAIAPALSRHEADHDGERNPEKDDE